MHIDTASVRMLLREAQTPIVRVEPFSDNPGTPGKDGHMLSSILGAPRDSAGVAVTRIASSADLSRWAVLETWERLRRAHLAPPTGLMPPVWQLLIGVLADNFLSSQIDFDLTPSLSEFLDSHRADVQVLLGADQVECLTGDFLSGDSRSALLRLSPWVSRYDGLALARLVRIKPSRRPPRISPTWSERFQRPDRPIQFWFDSTPQGTSLFVVHYTVKCNYLQCPWCSLPRLSSAKPIGPVDLFAQADYVFSTALEDAEKREIRSVLISNNGSVFDERTFSPTALHYTVLRACQHLPKLDLVVFETRAEYVTEAALRPLRTSLDDVGRPVAFEIAIGVEAFDDTIRNRTLKKGLSLRALQRMAELLREYRGGLRCYFMLKPVAGMSDVEALADVARGLDFLDSLVQQYEIPVIMHLNPTYAAVGSDLAEALQRGQFNPPRLDSLIEFLGRPAKRRTKIHVGLNDEGLAVNGGSFIRPEAEEAIRVLRRFNRTGRIELR